MSDEPFLSSENYQIGHAKALGSEIEATKGTE